MDTIWLGHRIAGQWGDAHLYVLLHESLAGARLGAVVCGTDTGLCRQRVRRERLHTLQMG